MDRGTWQATVYGWQRARHDWATNTIHNMSTYYIFPFRKVLNKVNVAYMGCEFSRSIVSNSLRPHELQHARLPCSSPIPRVYSNSCPLSQWCHLILCHPLLLLPSIFPSIRVFSNESVLCIRCQRIGVSASASVLPMNIQDWSPLGWTGWISLQSKRFSRVFSNTTVQKHQFFGAQLSSQSNSLIHTWPLEKP